MTAAEHTAAADGAPRIILASQSPRRRDLLSLIGIPYTVRPADIDESVRPGSVRSHVSSDSPARRLNASPGAEGGGPDEAVIIAADTIVVIDDRILNKPVDVSDARAMLRSLQGRTHAVHTAVCVVRGARRAADLATVGVRFRRLRDDEIDAYIATGEPMDKAGAYGIQGYGATIVVYRDGRADGQGRRLRHSRLRCDDRRPHRWRFLRGHGTPARHARAASCGRGGSILLRGLAGELRGRGSSGRRVASPLPVRIASGVPAHSMKARTVGTTHVSPLPGIQFLPDP